MNTQLDVRTIETRFKHPFIFENFDRLLHGEILTLVNDHDPILLFYQFQAERTGSFSWEYMTRGPEVWQVNITKTRNAAGETVADVVRENHRAAAIFKKLNIDYCCHGNRPFEIACAELGLVPEEVKKQIRQATTEAPVHVYADRWPLDFLVDFIIQNHHSYVKTAIPQIEELLEKVENVHGKEHPEIHSIHKHFVSLAVELLQHMNKEENILFSVIKEGVAGKNKTLAANPSFRTLRHPIAVMEEEHAGAGEDMENIRKLTNNFTPPAGACYSFKSLYRLLEEFQDDLHQHVHLENNILFPKVISLENLLR